MSFSHALADRIRRLLGQGRGIAEKKMFGGLCFLLDDKMLVGIMGSSLIARLGPDEAAKALQEDNVHVFDITGRPMKGWVVVEPDGLDIDRQLQSWLERAMRFVETVPSKTEQSPLRRSAVKKSSGDKRYGPQELKAEKKKKKKKKKK